ncbi:MAG: GreA/GreB family elongation factor [Candidatus Eremiobacteraeota bacterium]|nr:GreA/GreB family elongation factor [Candidatus Eremiobacteraeota bacterium]
MSRAFVKERDDVPEPEPVAPTRGPYFVTREQLESLGPDDARRERAQIIEVDAHTVGVGARVAIRDESGTVSNYTILNDEDADPTAGSIGLGSPLGEALAGKRKGEHALWHRPLGDMALQVVDVRYAARH